MIKEAIVKIVNKEDLTYDEAYTCLLYTSQHSAAAQCHNEITAVLFGKGSAFHHHFLDRVFHNLSKFRYFHTCFTELLQRAVIPVSYTHLDVYKRQAAI